MAMSKTYIATPPGVTIKEQLDDREMTQKEFSVRMGMSEKHISKLINGEVRLTPEVANKLEMVLGLPASFWNNLEAIYREKLVKVQDENAMEDDISMSKNFPYAEMAKYGWVASTKSPVERVVNLRKHFEVSLLTLLTSTRLPQVAYRKAGESDKSYYALIAWAQRAKIEARDVDVQAVNIEKLESILPEIRTMTKQSPEVFCDRLREILASCGIVLVFLPHIGGSFLHGATFTDGNKIVIGLTVRGKYADTFWFSLFHEIGHIILGHAWLTRDTTDVEEHDADDFARTKLIPQDRYSEFTKQCMFDRVSVTIFADSVGIAPGIVVGRLQKDGLINYSQLSDLKIKYELTA